ncbi:non-hydrolyzing UDP-N-acetylglucosamine 2-epimerase [Dyadobacter aurulentus]|uniref:non-hydrolyzing UDP-N-acetylglucosamine 2-epimerase n=1 Tax=Dyadobacter sp. UC 10 TaxID=2605428 RepID=UPI0011F1615A|nr:UDP-N-acetylglucosamine 2-epimerase (non-hydrolyzing) [Dyadobacter sp. UC 10]KAA0989658.1 UDP-N-acetylglucosamine 2-epimerase (non-hydrolyzing) [Dyadobacter sp. UC 10]
MKILSIVGARPNFVKIAPLHRAFSAYPDIESKIVHTGQHHDFIMSGIFFKQLQIPRPDHFLGINGGTHTQQTAQIMLAFEEVVLRENPDLIIVVGDVNSTLACALVAVKMHIPVAHVEAGLRSGDRTMPEEINRIMTDSISDLLFVTEQSAVQNLLRENVPSCKIHLAGNVMIDSLVYCQQYADNLNIDSKLGVPVNGYMVITMHRPANVDSIAGLTKLLEVLKSLTVIRPVIFPVHPRTLKNIHSFQLFNDFSVVQNLKLIPALGYLEFISLVKNAALVITDSGGVQEETTYLQIPCITLRSNTERPVTILEGTNHLLPDFTVDSVMQLTREILSNKTKNSNIPPCWDGNAAVRIASILREKYINS